MKIEVNLRKNKKIKKNNKVCRENEKNTGKSRDNINKSIGEDKETSR